MRQPQGAFFTVVPKQHGAWTVLIASFIIGSSVGARFSLEVILLLVSVIAAFLGRGALGMCLSLSPAERRTQGLSAWIMLYFGLFLLTGDWLVFWYKLRLLGLLGIVGMGLAAFSLRLEKNKNNMRSEERRVGKEGRGRASR